MIGLSNPDLFFFRYDTGNFNPPKIDGYRRYILGASDVCVTKDKVVSFALVHYLGIKDYRNGNILMKPYYSINKSEMKPIEDEFLSLTYLASEMNRDFLVTFEGELYIKGYHNNNQINKSNGFEFLSKNGESVAVGLVFRDKLKTFSDMKEVRDLLACVNKGDFQMTASDDNEDKIEEKIAKIDNNLKRNKEELANDERCIRNDIKDMNKAIEVLKGHGYSVEMYN